jgi:hypothetical protein
MPRLDRGIHVAHTTVAVRMDRPVDHPVKPGEGDDGDRE